MIMDEAGLSVYANRAEQYTAFLEMCMGSYADIVRSILGAGQGLYDTDITARLLEMVQAVEALRESVASAGTGVAAELREDIQEIADADVYRWEDGGFAGAAAILAGC